MVRYTYAAWDGPPEVLPFSPEALLDALTTDFLQHGDLDWALNELLRRADTSPDEAHASPGFPELLQQLEQQQQLLQHDAEASLPLSAQPAQPLQQAAAAGSATAAG